MESQIFPPGHVVVEGGKFDHAAHPFQHLIGFWRQDLSKQFDRAAGGFPKVGQHFHHSSFTRPVWAKETVYLTLSDVKINIHNQLFFVDPFCELVGL